MTFQSWVQDLIDGRFGTATSLAKAIGMELSPFTRGVKSGTLNLVNLLKLAKVAEEPPGTVLRLAAKQDEAELLESLYGTTAGLTASQREIVERVQRLTPRARAHFLGMLREWQQPSTEDTERSSVKTKRFR